MNFADEAAKLWGRHLFLKAKINDRTADNRQRADQRVDTKIKRAPVLAKSRDKLIIKELKEINDADLIRASMIDEDKFIREQVDSLNLLALVHGHKPTGKWTNE